MKTDSHYWLKIAARFLPLACAVYFFSFVTADPDLWGHLRFGMDHLRAGELDRFDPYSYTAAGGPWINHEWLCELIFYLVYKYLGDCGLLMGKLAIGFGVMGLLIGICALRPHHPLALALSLSLAAAALSKGFMIRPQLFSFLLFTLFLYLYHLYFFRDRNRLWLLPLLMALWVNLHGGFLMGWALAIGITGWQTLVRLITRRPDPKLAPLWICLAAVSLATLANPYGFGLLAFLRYTLSMPRQISEWAPIGVWDLSYPRLKLMALLCIGVLAAARRRALTWEAAAAAAVLVISFKQQRHTPFFGIVAAPFLCHWLSVGAEGIAAKYPKWRLTPPSRWIIAAAVALMALFPIQAGIHRYRAAECRIIVNPAEYPVTAIRFLKDNNARGRLMLPFNWGEHAIWWLHPSCLVSIDGRFRTVYPESVIRDHFIPREDGRGWMRLMEKYPPDILLAPQNRFFHDFIEISQGMSPPWVYVHSDSTAIVFVRDNGENDALLERMRKGGIVRPGSPDIYFP